jgi:CHAD domain-containing protein
MKRQELKQVTGRYTGQVKKYSCQIPGAFALEDIHDLRVAYKKLRAWLRLLQGGVGAVCMPAALKNLYRAAGTVRDEQLLLHMISTLVMPQQPLPVFTQYIQCRLFADKEQLVKAIEHIHFKEVQNTIHQSLPANWQHEVMHKFIQVKTAAIRLTLLAGVDDKGLHTSRKHLKDIIYNGKTLQSLGLAWPTDAGWVHSPLLQGVSERLGVFNDHCNTAAWLQAAHVEDLPPEEKSHLNKWQQEWEERKDLLRNELWKEVAALTKRPV